MTKQVLQVSVFNSNTAEWDYKFRGRDFRIDIIDPDTESIKASFEIDLNLHYPNSLIVRTVDGQLAINPQSGNSVTLSEGPYHG